MDQKGGQRTKRERRGENKKEKRYNHELLAQPNYCRNKMAKNIIKLRKC